MSKVPGGIGFDHGIEDGQEFSQAGDEPDFEGFVLFGRAGVEGFQQRVAAQRIAERVAMQSAQRTLIRPPQMARGRED